MMTSASWSLCSEGWMSEPFENKLGPEARTLLGVLIGFVFIIVTGKFLDKYEHLKVPSKSNLQSKKLFLIVFVMTLHSFAEGVGIGVSFGGPHGPTLGKYISVSLAVHNVPEGLAVAIVMLGQDFTLLEIALWCIMTSLPQVRRG
jgi:zinc transporter, ZIP family